MVDLTMLQVVRDLVAIFGVIAAFSYYVLIVRNSQRTQQLQLETRKAQLFMQLYDRLNDKEFCESYGRVVWRFEWKDFEDWRKKYEPVADLDAWTSWVSVARYFLGIGTLMKKKLIDTDMVDDLMGGPVSWAWEKMEPIVKEMRVYLKRPQLWNDYEYLYNEIKKREQNLELKT